MTIDPLSQPLDPAKALTGAAKEKADLKNVCKQFESFFLNQLLQEMRKTVPKSDLMGGQGNSEEIYQSMADQSLADTMSKRGSFGIADMMYRELSRKIVDDTNTQAVSEPTPANGTPGAETQKR